MTFIIANQVFMFNPGNLLQILIASISTTGRYEETNRRRKDNTTSPISDLCR